MINSHNCVITGVTSGLGAYIAESLVTEGWEVTGIGRKPNGHKDIPSGISYLQTDLSIARDVAILPEQIGVCPRLFIHCAVTYPSKEMSDIDKVFQVNAIAPFQITHGLLAGLSKEQIVTFIMVNSEAMFNADEKSGVYGASKAALKVLTTSLAHECIGMNASVSTLILGPLADKQKTSELEKIATNKNVSVEDITRLFLRKSNPRLVLDDLIKFDSCLKCIRCIYELGPDANGMLCRLDGSAGGSLI